jgi:AcrR family transcriptional regulator
VKKTRHIRKKPDVRAEEILTVARDILAKEGYEGLTFRAVAGGTGVRMSSVQYYYPNRGRLYFAVVAKTMEEWYEGARNILELDSAPEVRLDLICQWNITEVLKVETRSILFQILGMAQRELDVSQMLNEGYLLYRKLFARVLQEIRPDLEPMVLMTYATLFVSHLEGLAIFMEPDDFARPSEVLLRELSRHFVRGYITGLKGVSNALPKANNRRIKIALSSGVTE